MTDDELRSMLRAWEAPPAPERLRERVLGPRRAWWQWFFSGEVRIPAPVALAMLFLLAFIAYQSLQTPAVSLSDFEQVDQFKPRIVRTINENR